MKIIPVTKIMQKKPKMLNKPKHMWVSSKLFCEINQICWFLIINVENSGSA